MEYSQLFLAPISNDPDASPAPEDHDTTSADQAAPSTQHAQPHAYRELFSDRSRG
ncbi:hypothetical protein [Lolliginicoccus suaedae]|uniref:hypothetical protein n=1 Tax=Lolliginicoccus suaedae TaxID=2605429 RepID=UPI001658CA08|nr:hypothetical protein [Lolliginicoccus suaedae]